MPRKLECLVYCRRFVSECFFSSTDGVQILKMEKSRRQGLLQQLYWLGMIKSLLQMLGTAGPSYAEVANTRISRQSIGKL